MGFPPPQKVKFSIHGALLLVFETHFDAFSNNERRQDIARRVGIATHGATRPCPALRTIFPFPFTLNGI